MADIEIDVDAERLDPLDGLAHGIRIALAPFDVVVAGHDQVPVDVGDDLGGVVVAVITVHEVGAERLVESRDRKTDGRVNRVVRDVDRDRGAVEAVGAGSQRHKEDKTRHDCSPGEPLSDPEETGHEHVPTWTGVLLSTLPIDPIAELLPYLFRP